MYQIGIIRIIAILAGILVAFSTRYLMGFSLYVSLPLGAIGYLAARYVGWAINERRNLKREMDKARGLKDLPVPTNALEVIWRHMRSVVKALSPPEKAGKDSSPETPQ